MEYNIQKYQFLQNGKDYVVSTGLVGDKIRITCQENLALDGPFYCNEFSLYDLRAANQFFRLTQTTEEALIEINKGIERQKTALKPGINDTMQFIGYLVIGTDNDAYNLILRRDNEPNKYGVFTPPSSGAADLVLNTNYHVDGERLNNAEKNFGNLQRQQTLIEEELNNTIPEINKLKKITFDIEEENALIRERIRILQNQLEQRKNNVIRLKQQNMNLKRENLNLNNHIKNQENSIRYKQAIQANVKVQERPNINPGVSAVASKFVQSALRTFLSRTGAKPTIEGYSQNLNYINSIPTQIITTTQVIPNDIETTYLPTIFQQPKIVFSPPLPPPPQQVIINIPQPNITTTIQQPIVNNTTPQKLLRNSIYSISSNNSYKNPTYPAYLSSGSKEVIYKNRLDFPYPNYYKSVGKNTNSNKEAIININKDTPYTSGMAQNRDKHLDAPYSSGMSQNNDKHLDAPYSSGMAKNKDKHLDAPYSSGMAQNNDKHLDAPYSSGIAQNKEKHLDMPYSSQMGQNKIIPLENNNLLKSNSNDIKFNNNIMSKYNANSVGKNSQMIKKQGNIGDYTKPKGSRLPKVNLGNYSGNLLGSKNTNTNSKSNSSQQKESLIIGYSSYEPEKKNN